MVKVIQSNKIKVLTLGKNQFWKNETLMKYKLISSQVESVYSTPSEKLNWHLFSYKNCVTSKMRHNL